MPSLPWTGTRCCCFGGLWTNRFPTRVKANNSRSETLTAEGIAQELDRLTKELQAGLQECEAVDKAEDTLFGVGVSGLKVPPELATRQARKTELEKALQTVREMDEQRRRTQQINPAKNPAQLPMTDSDSRVLPKIPRVRMRGVRELPAAKAMCVRSIADRPHDQPRSIHKTAGAARRQDGDGASEGRVQETPAWRRGAVCSHQAGDGSAAVPAAGTGERQDRMVVDLHRI